MSKLYIDRLADLTIYESYPEDQDVVVPLGVLRRVQDALDCAANGLQWYRDSFPQADSGADDEMMNKVKAVLADIDESDVVQA